MTRPSVESQTCTPGEARPGAVLTVLVIGTFLAPLDSSIVNMALPAIAAHFGERLSSVGWVTTAFLLTSAALLLSMGRLGDMWGLRRIYVGGLVVFAMGSAACALSPSLNFLIGARVFQAVGGAMLFAAAPALIAKGFPAGQRGRALGYISVSVSAGLMTGPALGGLLVGTFGWPAVFLLNVPLALGVAIVSWRLLPYECSTWGRFDLLGALLAGAALLMFLLGLGAAEHSSSFSVEVWLPLAAAIVLISAFVAWEDHFPEPMVDLGLFRSRAFTAGVSAGTLAYLSLFSVTFTMPFYLLRVQGMDPRAAGLLLTATPIVLALVSPVAGRLADRKGSRMLATAGIATMSLGLVVLSFLVPGSSPLHVVAGLLIVGSGMALFQAPNTVAILRSTPPSRVGVGSAFVAEARNVGMAIGVALTAAILGMAIGPEGLPQGAGELPEAFSLAFTGGMSNALRTAAVIALIGAGLSWFGRGRELGVVEGRRTKP